MVEDRSGDTPDQTDDAQLPFDPVSHEVSGEQETPRNDELERASDAIAEPEVEVGSDDAPAETQPESPANEGTDVTPGEEPESQVETPTEPVAAEPVADAPKIAPTRALLFIAPDLPPQSERDRRAQADRAERDERAGGGRGARDERDERDEADDEQEGRGRRRGRGRRDRQESQESKSGRKGRRGGQRDDEQDDADEAPLITEPQKIKGSTRLEAKRQRRREGRESGRRRPVVTESEFLARREAVDRVMLVRAKGQKVQLGVLEDKVLVEHYVARSEEASLIGNVYLGRVQNVLPSMEAAFIDIGRGRNAVLYSGEVDWAAAELGSNQARRIENALKPGDRVLVQVTKDPVGHKGARLTSQVSLPGRYLVYVPGNAMNGISRKLPDTERSRLKKILKEVLPPGVGVIVRTAAEGATREQLERDVNRLTAQWEDIQKRVSNGPAPALLHSEPDLLIKIIRDVFNEDFQKLIIQGPEELETISNYLSQVAPDLLERVEAYSGDDIFETYRATEFIEKALDRKVWLPSGGSLVIDRTEAMTVVDVNTGKFVGSGGNLEETVTKNNLEAAEEVVRQLRLRDIGGIIVIDFIDMVLETNRDLVLRRLVECLSRDRTKHQVAEVTSLGLVQMTRKKLGLGLLETFSEPCESCAGRGVLVYHDPVTKHRVSNEQQGGGRGRRGRGQGGDGRSGGSNSGQNSGQASQNAQGGTANGNGNGNGSTHGITEEARGALSRIAASTIAGTPSKPDGADTAEQDGTATTAPEPTTGPADEGQERREGGRRSRRGRRRGRGKRDDEQRDSGEANDESSRPEDAASGDSADTGASIGEELHELRHGRGQMSPAVAEATPDLDALSALSSALDAIAPGGDEVTDEAEADSVAEAEEAPVEVVAEAPAAAEQAPEPAETAPRGASGRPKRRRVTVGMGDE